MTGSPLTPYGPLQGSDSEGFDRSFVHSILVGEHHCTVEEANAINERSPDATPIIDALKACIGKASQKS